MNPYEFDEMFMDIYGQEYEELYRQAEAQENEEWGETLSFIDEL